MKVISGKQMCRVLEQRGWVLARVNGSHHIYRHSARSDHIVPVPLHNRDLKAGTLRGILKLAEMSEAEFLDLL